VTTAEQPPAGGTGSDEQLLREENAQLRSRLAELRSRLKEPEEIIRAIRHGEVDALVVTEPRGEKIYSLRTPDILYRGMIEEMQDGAVALDGSGTIVYCNHHFAQLMACDRAALLGASIFTFVPYENRAFFIDALKDGATRTASRSELLLRAQTGALMPVLATMNCIERDGGEVFCLIATDLSGQKREEELLAESRRKDLFLAMLAHELRNPIAPIRNAAHLLRLGAPDEGRVRWARDVIDRQVAHMARLIDDLLDVSRITRGTIRLDLEVIDVAAVVARSVETVQPLIDARHHELTVEMAPGPMLVRADLTRVSQAISNLLNNAAKFTPEGGRIRLSVESKGAWVRITIRDSGVGISADLLPRIFDLFTQADSTPSRAQGGLGIGLTLVRTLIEMHGGTVEAHSPGPGRGAELVVRLPLLAPAGSGEPGQTGQHREAPKAQPAERRRVLVIEDNLDVAETLAVLLEAWGHEVRSAGDGPSALAQAQAFRPEVVLVDIGLPGMDGYQVARALRRMPDLAGSRLIALTGYGQEEDRRVSRDAGFDEHCVKPVDPDALAELVATAPRRP
jgi:PAS domain S-box-containing protein